MNTKSIVIFAVAMGAIAAALRAQVPPLINYQGRVAVGTVNFNGAGQFKFALVNAAGSTIYWTNSPDITPLDGVPDTDASLTVTKGLYSVLLGDTTVANMAAIPASVFNNSDVRLRVWFNDGTNGSQLLTPDQRIAAVGYAIVAGGVPDGAITSAKIASGAVGATQLANNAVGSAQLADASITTAKIAAGAVGNSQLAPGAVSGDFWASTAASGLAGRYFHTAVWTGSEMIVWGGYSGSYLNDGSRYNPALNSWTATPTSGLAGRYSHTAVWTGSEMIVWGGAGAGGVYFNDGGRYNPVSNTWTGMATAIGTAPTARRRHTAVWTGSEMIVWGGYDGTYLNTGGRYHPTANSWTDTSASGAAVRSEHSAVWTGSEMIVWGGITTGGTAPLNDGRRYNPAANTWAATNLSGAPDARFTHTAVWSGSEMIIWGGRANLTYYADGGRYNPAGNSWTMVSTTGAPAGRDSHTAVWAGSRMVVWGGLGGPLSSNALNSGGHYDPAANTWTPTEISGAPAARSAHTAVWSGVEMIVWGGITSPTYFNDGARLRLSNIRAASIGTVQLALPLQFSAANPSGSILSGANSAIGGTGVSGTSGNTGSGVSGTGGTGVTGVSTGGTTGIGISGDGGTGTGVKGVASGSTSIGVYGVSADGTGVYGESTSNNGVIGTTTTGRGVWGISYGSGLAGRFEGNVDAYGKIKGLRGGSVGELGGDTAAVEGRGAGGAPGMLGIGGSPNGTGVSGVAGTNGYGIYGSSNTYAGWFAGAVNVTGSLFKGGGAFRIDHPLDPANKYLSHSFVESPDMMNIYNGNITLGGKGEAVVVLPEWFGALNKEFRYQLTCMGGFAPIYIAEEIAGNRFKIAGGKPGMKVSWQVTGIRQDAWANANRIPLEEDKPAKERGSYLHPAAFGQPAGKAVEWARNPEMMRQMNERPTDPSPISQPKR